MFNVHIEIPIGAMSRGYNFVDAQKAATAWASAITQLKSWPLYTADVVLTQDGVEIQREHTDTHAKG